MDEKRNHERFTAALQAQYRLSDVTSGVCKVLELSAEGTRIEIVSPSRLEIDTKIHLDISFPPDSRTVPVVLYIKWHKERELGDAFILTAGGMIFAESPEDDDCIRDYISRSHAAMHHLQMR